MIKNIFLFSFVLTLGFTSCNKSLSEEEQYKEDIKLIKNYIHDHELNAEETDSGLHYVIDNLGTGNFPNANTNVTVRYKGYTLNNKVFDESEEEGITFNLQQVIEGWTEGIQKYKEGGSGLLLIPSRLGYGDKKAGSIPANSVLIFEVELLNING